MSITPTSIQQLNTQEHSSFTSSTIVSSKIAALLRLCGSILIVFAAISFLLQGVNGIVEVYRYWVALAMILMLSLCGVMCAYGLNESKGARLLFALAGAFLSVQITQLSAMLHGYFFGTDRLDYQQFFAWWQFDSVSLFTIMMNFFATVLLAAPVIYTAFSLLARNQRKLLCTAFIVSNALLLLPFRVALLTPMVIFAAIVYLRFINKRLYADGRMRTFEGILARLIIWIPVLIMVGRGLLYPVSVALPVTLLGYIAFWLLHDVRQVAKSKRIILVSELLGVVIALLAWLCLAYKYIAVIHPMLLLLPVALLLFLLSNRVVFFGRLYRTAGSLLALLICINFEFTGYALALLSILCGVALMVSAIQFREKLHLVTGLICFISGLLYYFQYVLYFYHASPWLSAIALGLAVVVLASYIESREQQLVEKSKEYYFEIKSWQ